jgi:Mg/Co/Ni transporter MgtE|tara:strand:+ start:755 stop:1096 length:342 start_codon:yes stop_codon:yes gene_type:complete
MIDKTLYTLKKGRQKQPATEMAASSRDELLYLLSPIYSPDALKDLDDDALRDLINEMADRMARKDFNDGGSSDKPPVLDPFEVLDLTNKIAAMSDEERKNLEFMLNKLGVKKK